MTKELNNTDNKSSMKKRFRRNNQQMKQIKEFLCDEKSPTNDEVERCLKIAKNENCVINLYWDGPNKYTYNIFIRDNMTFEECVEQIPKFYPM